MGDKEVWFLRHKAESVVQEEGTGPTSRSLHRPWPWALPGRMREAMSPSSPGIHRLLQGQPREHSLHTQTPRSAAFPTDPGLCSAYPCTYILLGDQARGLWAPPPCYTPKWWLCAASLWNHATGPTPGPLHVLGLRIDSGWALEPAGAAGEVGHPAH